MDFPKDCPFCLSNNLLKVGIIAENDLAYLIESISNPGNYLVMPKNHAVSPYQIPDGWWKYAAELIKKVPVELNSYNLSFNIGKASGQTIPHLHMWIIPRISGYPSSSMGLAGLINKVNSL